MGNKPIVSGLELQKFINGIESIISSKAKLDDMGNPVEIHALADKSRNAKQIVRDIQSAVVAMFDLEIDHRIISIAQLNCEKLVQKDFCIKLKGIEVISKGLELDVKVELAYRDESFCGEQGGINTAGGIKRTLAWATLKAVSDYINVKACFVVEDVKNIIIAGTKVVFVAVTYVDENGEQLLIGSEVDSGNMNETVVKATLDAVNRRLCKLITGH